MNNKILLGVAVVLLALSLWSYNSSQTRAQRFERGQKFLSQLNPDSIQVIDMKKGEDHVVLKKDDKEFLVATKANYPAKNEAVNRFINDVIDIGLEKRVGSGESLAKELGVFSTENAETLEVILKDESDKVMVHFLVGKATDDGRGNYLKRVEGGDQDIYLSSKGVYLSPKADTFLKKEILDVKAADIAAIHGSDYTFSGDTELALQGIPAGKQASSATGQAKNMLAGLQYDQVFLADDSEVASLAFNTRVQVDLKDGTGYVAELAKKDGKYFLKIEGTFDQAADEAARRIGQNESEEELKKKSDTLTRNDEIRTFNNFHGSWVYQLSEYVGKKFDNSKKDLIEDEKSDKDSE